MNRRSFFRTIPAAAAAAVVAPAAIAQGLPIVYGRMSHIDHQIANMLMRKKYVANIMAHNKLFDELKWIDADWHPGMVRQAESRCHRRGQKPVVEMICFAP